MQRKHGEHADAARFLLSIKNSQTGEAAVANLKKYKETAKQRKMKKEKLRRRNANHHLRAFRSVYVRFLLITKSNITACCMFFTCIVYHVMRMHCAKMLIIIWWHSCWPNESLSIIGAVAAATITLDAPFAYVFLEEEVHQKCSSRPIPS